MQRRLTGLAAIVTCLFVVPTSCAGLYNTAEPFRGPRLTQMGVEPLSFAQFRDLLTTELSISGTLQESPRRKHYLGKRDELRQKERAGALTTEEKVNLSEYLIRLGQVEEAVQLLEPVARQERQNFMVFANLGTAHQLAGRLDRAISYLEQVKDYWPQTWPGLNKEQLDWCKKSEQYHLKLVRLRYRELRQQPAGRSKAPDSLDDLFGGEKGSLHFVGDSGRYEAGKLAANEREKLPSDAVAIVQQLLLWIPGGGPGLEDTRLYWLIGELYNAEGYTVTAAQVFDQCVFNRGYTFPEIREHQKIVKAAQPEPEPVASKPLESRPGQAPAIPQPETRRLDMRQVWLAGGVVGLVVAGLIYLQIREIIRRRRSS